jgi:hypothetical protein
MNRLSVLVAALLILTGGVVARAGDKKEDGKKVEQKVDGKDEKKAEEGKETVYDSPRDVFGAFLAAVKKGDGKTACGCLTEDGAKRLVAALALNAVTLREFAGKAPKGKGVGEKVEELSKALLAACAKHGLTAEQLQRLDLDALPGRPGANPGNPPAMQAIKKLIERVNMMVKDRCGFIGDGMLVLVKAAGEGATVELLGVSAKGDTGFAFAMLKGPGGGRGGQPAMFKKVGGSWKIEYAPVFLPGDVPAMIPPLMPGPQGGPPPKGLPPRGRPSS